jgi:hypothetical protein
MRIKKVDRNQPEIVKQLRKIPGVSVAHTHTVGDGFSDLVVGYKGKNYLCEVKDPAKPPSARKLTPDEEKFHSEWKGQVSVVESVTDILKLINQ